MSRLQATISTSTFFFVQEFGGLTLDLYRMERAMSHNCSFLKCRLLSPSTVVCTIDRLNKESHDWHGQVAIGVVASGTFPLC
jgi:hypothetical protein